jgi:hypothetical protein
MKTQDLAFSEAENELVLSADKPQSKPKKWPKTHLFCGIEEG